MYCKFCGSTWPEGGEICSNCGANWNTHGHYCAYCGTVIADGQQQCSSCGNPVQDMAPPQGDSSANYYQPPQGNAGPNQGYYQAPPQGAPGQYPPPPPPGGYQPKSKMAAGLLGIFLGSLGIHNFYLGYTGKAIGQLVLCIVGGIITCGIASIAAEIWGLIEGIMILTGSINVDANGVPLQD